MYAFFFLSTPYILSIRFSQFCLYRKLVFSDVNPYFELFNFWTFEMAVDGVIVLMATLILFFFTERPWCKLSKIIMIYQIQENYSLIP